MTYPTQHNVRLYADTAQFLDRMLCWFGLYLTRSLKFRNQRQVKKNRVITPQLDPHLANRLQEWQGFDITDRPPDLD